MKKSESDSLSEKPYLIRSYDYEPSYTPDQSRKNTPRSTRVGTGGSRFTTNGGAHNSKKSQPLREINRGRAQDFEIWEVARAATAATTYFEPLEIQSENGGMMIFTDGGFDLNNNPTMEAKAEILNLYREEQPVGVVVSVGTARKARDPNKKRPWYKSIPGLTEDLGDKATNPEKYHEDIQREVNEFHKARGFHKFPYYRLNDPGGLDIELDECKPHKGLLHKEGGSTTFGDIETAFAKWFSVWTNSHKLQQCAEDLVDCRMQRSQSERWEQHATGCEIRCQVKGCDSESRNFKNSEKFRKHLRDAHDFVEKQHIEDEVLGSRKPWRYPRTN